MHVLRASGSGQDMEDLFYDIKENSEDLHYM